MDLSIDPFELIGFAKTGALADDAMRVYDTRSAGFWPGEGCGLVVLMRHDDALARQLPVYALIRGWGVSSDGGGGITRPEVEGQLLALRRAYTRAGYGIDTVAYFEGHGTGTAVGDATELQALTRARREVERDATASHAKVPPAAISSIKANIGHTKAAAGVAGLIKATMALHTQVLPPTTGCDEPHAELREGAPALRVLRRGELFPAEAHLRAGVSAMGFGGINTHITLEAARAERRQSLNSRERVLLSSAQDAELFLFDARDIADLSEQIARLDVYAARLSRGELTDLAATLARSLGHARIRAAVVAASPAELAARLATLKLFMRADAVQRLDPAAGIFFNAESRPARVGFLFPGQGAPAHLDGGAWRRRFDFIEDLYALGDAEWRGDGVATEVAQPAIATASVAALRLLARLGVTARVAVGHSLGELCALHWAGAFDEAALLRTARARGRAMASIVGPTGAMLSVGADEHEVKLILNGDQVVIAGLNSPQQTILSGEAAAVAAVARRCAARGLRCTPLRVSHAFHSPLIAPAATRLTAHLADEEFAPVQRAVVSTVTGARLTADTDLRALLGRQVTEPVRFIEAIAATADDGIDLWLEVGPGRALTGLMAELAQAPAIALDACGPSLRDLLNTVGACFVVGAEINHDELFTGRLTRPFNLDWRPRFFVNPCELAPQDNKALTTHGRIAEAGEAISIEADSSEAENISANEQTGTHLDEQSKVTDAPIEVVRRLVAERVELPVSTVKDDSRLLDDLHLNSITVAQLVAAAARSLGVPPPPAPTHYANASLVEIAAALEAAARNGDAAQGQAEDTPPGVAEWVRPFAVALVERALPTRAQPAGPGHWRVFAPADHPLGDELRATFARLDAGRGVVVALPSAAAEEHITLLLEGARAALAGGDGFRFVLVQHAGGAAAFARTLHLEAKDLVTCIVDVPLTQASASSLISAEALAARGYSEAHYDNEGVRRVPVLRPLLLDVDDVAGEPEPTLTAADVLVVTGGARGITAECALALARESGAQLALFGLTRPEEDDEIAANLDRMKAAGVGYRFYRVDVTDAAAVRAAVRAVERELGAVTGILHGAARNVPCLIENLDTATCAATLRPKLQGAQNLLAAVNPDRLRLFIAFGSIIARMGLAGEADYGLANEWLTRLTEHWQTTHTHCRCLAVEWSVWSGVGMGARLGALDALVQLGVNPISPEQGVGMLRRLLGARNAPVAAVVMGRFRELPTLEIERPELPFLRFLEKPRVFYPQVELVVDADLSPMTDPYLDDHTFRGARLLPAVMGLEAMAQTVMALTNTDEPPAFTDVSFERPITIGAGSTNTIRIAALARNAGRVDVVLRSAETNFQADHFRASCWVNRTQALASDPVINTKPADEAARVPLEPERDLYGKVLFHRGRFRRLGGYRVLRATECLAEIVPDGATSWFGPYLPGGLLLGDPGARDAAIHAVQACIPQATLLPVGVGQITVGSGDTGAAAFVRARELERLGDGFIYDLELLDSAGRVRERWAQLRLRIVVGADFQGPWPAGLLAPYVERRVQELISSTAVSVAFERAAAADRRARSTRAFKRALGAGVHVRRRADGKPEASDGRSVSASHCADLTMAVAARTPVGCDIERVEARPHEVWRDLLGLEHFALAELIGRETGDSTDTAATRVWAACECLKKAGAGGCAPLVLAAVERDGWVVLAAGELKVVSGVLVVEGSAGPLIVAVSAEGGEDARV